MTTNSITTIQNVGVTRSVDSSSAKTATSTDSSCTLFTSGNSCNNQSANLGAGNNNTAQSQTSGLGDFCRGIGNVSNSVAGSLMGAGTCVNAIASQPIYVNANLLRHSLFNNPWGGCGWGWRLGFPMWSMPPIMPSYNTSYFQNQMQMQPLYAGPGVLNTLNSLGFNNLSIGNSSYTPYDTIIPINNPYSSTGYANNIWGSINTTGLNGNSPTIAQTMGTTFNDGAGTPMSGYQTNSIETCDATGKISTPSWYKAIVSKAERKEHVSTNEQKLRDTFEKLYWKYSPYELDQYKNRIQNADGSFVPSAFYKEMFKFQDLLNAKDCDAIERYIKSCSAEKLAALEAHYSSMPFSEGKTLRKAIKDSSLCWGFGWTGYNTDRCNRIFDMLDKASTINPKNAALALNQAINNHRICEFGVDDNRVSKILKSIGDNKAFMDAVEEEYMNLPSATTLRSDLGRKWFISDSNEKVVEKYL